MKNLDKLGKISLGHEVTNISQFGLWILTSGKEYFLDHNKYPWFKNASVEKVLSVESPRPGHLRWPELDIDLHIDSLDFPERYPLVAKSSQKKRV